MQRLNIWFKAVFFGYPFWRVRYKNGTATYPLYEPEATGLAETFNGKKYIDYDYGARFLQKIK